MLEVDLAGLGVLLVDREIHDPAEREPVLVGQVQLFADHVARLGGHALEAFRLAAQEERRVADAEAALRKMVSEEQPALAERLAKGEKLADDDRAAAMGTTRSAAALEPILSGLWLENQLRYDLLLASGRTTLVDDFEAAGYRTAALMPAITLAWPEGERFGYEQIFAHADIDYAGPPLNWVTMPDQFTWSFLENRIRRSDDPRPLFAELGLINAAETSREADINRLMQMALRDLAVLPWAKLVDEWRWMVFSGEVTPDNYNQAWWDLRERYQGITPPVQRSEADFDPGAKYHIPANVSYTRYFLARILQFQLQRTLCDIAGHEGELQSCSLYGSKEAGAKFWDLLQKGESQPWQDTLEAMTGTRDMDATAIIDYFAPLMGYLKEQNEGRSCGW